MPALVFVLTFLLLQDVLRPQIVTAACGSTHISAPSAMADVHDNNAIDIGFVAQKVAEAASKVKAAAIDETPELKRFWNGLVDDILGPKVSKPA